MILGGIMFSYGQKVFLLVSCGWLKCLQKGMGYCLYRSGKYYNIIDFFFWN